MVDAPLASRTAILVGGPADLLVRPREPDDLSALLRAAAAREIPVLVLGGGANLLVSDRGVRGLVVKLPGKFGEEASSGERLLLSAAAPTSRLVSRAQASGLVGCEFLAGIPGTLGGAVAMNAGTRRGEMKDVVSRVEISTRDGAGWIEAGAMGFAYRTSRIPPGGVVTRVEVALRPGDAAASAEAMSSDRDYRRRTQPLGQPTFGSTFRNPPGDHAGRLIQAVGLKGHRIGNAAWSDVHANFIVNLGGARAEDVLALMRLARERVRAEFAVELEAEVRLAGDFSESDIS